MKQASINKKKAIKLLAKILKKSNGFPFSTIYSGRGQILMFHRVIPAETENRIWSNQFLEITPEFLEEIIIYYKNLNYIFLKISQVAEFLKNRGKQKFVAFTFDDGYKDNFTHALPVFEKHNIPFTIYITTDFPDGKINLWWYKLEKKVMSSNDINFIFNNKSYAFKNDKQDKNKIFEIIRNIILTTPENQINELFELLFKDITLNLSEYILTWTDIVNLSKNKLVEIGAHTVTHKSLGKLSPKDACFEIVQSKIIIESKINKLVKSFAYPYGGLNDFNENHFEILKENKFLTAVTTISNNTHTKSNLLALPRIAIGSSMNKYTLDLIRYGVIPFIRNKGKTI